MSRDWEKRKTERERDRGGRVTPGRVILEVLLAWWTVRCIMRARAWFTGDTRPGDGVRFSQKRKRMAKLRTEGERERECDVGRQPATQFLGVFLNGKLGGVTQPGNIGRAWADE